jgi:hypothetical protein
MGLLDEAIREHLELKRRSGADPSTVEREEREALAPLSSEHGLAGSDDQEGELEYEGGAYDGEELHYEEDGLRAGDVGPDDSPGIDEQRRAPSFADLADAGQQDTAELDMQAAMDADPEAAGAAPYAAPTGGSWATPYAGRQPEESSLEWELPGDREREPPPENIPGQERLSFE